MNPPPPPPPPPPSSAANFLPSQAPNPLPPPPSLPSALADLTSILRLSSSALDSLPIPSATTSATLLPCPFNPNHRLPPSSLFSHYLNCPSPLSLSHTFHYPHALQSSSSAATAARVTPPFLASASSDLSISLENYTCYNAYANKFFYQNCPGPVTPPTEPPPLLNLPRVLYIECADFDDDSTLKNAAGFSVDFISFFPSEIWAIRSEIEAWGGGFPAAYSSRILRAILKLKDCKLLRLCEWIVSNSPRYGVIVDFAMRDHMVLLIRLCLKVIVSEAFGLAGITSGNGELKMEENVLSGLSNKSFECPVLVKVMMWLALQFRILYGEVNGNFVAVDVLKECILGSTSHASLFHLERESAEQGDIKQGDGVVQEPVQSTLSTDGTKRDDRENIKGKTVGGSMIFISQVAAAVAALRERLLIEEKIKASRNSQQLSVYQRNMEHAYVSSVANEERKKRLDYRPIIEHDGILWQRSSNQETNKVKTREELLAEERDYKRRRMSYRGKKLKRNTLEVMRDIINEYMEEVKQAGGIGGMPKAMEEMDVLASEDLNTHANTTWVSGSSRNSTIPEENRGQSLDYRKELQSRDSEGLEDDFLLPRQDSRWDPVHHDLNKNAKRVRYDRDDYSRGQDGRKSSSHSREQVPGREKQGFVEAREGSSRRPSQRQEKSHQRSYHRYRDEQERYYHKRERGDRERTSHRSESSEYNWEHGDRWRSEADGAPQHGHEDNGGLGGRRRSKTNKSSSSRPEVQEFEDRYDPADSLDFYNDDS